MGDSKYKYVLPNKVLDAKTWMTKNNKTSYDIVKINVNNPNATENATYYQVSLMLPPSADAPADCTLEKYPLMFLHAAHQCKYGLKEVEKDSKYLTRAIQFGPYSTYELTLKGSSTATVQKYGEAKRWLANIITTQLQHYIGKGTITRHDDIATGVRLNKEVSEGKGKPKKKVPVDNVDDQMCSVEIPFARSQGGGRPTDDTPPSIKIGDAAKPNKNSDGSRSFDAPIIDGEKLNYGNIHHFVLAGSKFMGIEDCGSISYTKVGYSWCHKWMDDIVIRKGTGNTRAVEYKNDLDDSAYAGMGGDDEPEPETPKPAAATAKKPTKKKNDEDDIITDGGDEETVIPKPVVKAKAKAKPVPKPETDALDDFTDEVETPPKPVAKAKAKAKPAPVPVDDFGEELEAEPEPPKPKAKAKAKPAPDPLDDFEAEAEPEPPKPKAKAKAKAKPAPKPEPELEADDNFE